MHAYDPKTKAPCYYVATKDGQSQRPTRVADMVKNGWVPSVTEIQNTAAKWGLVNWMVEQAIKASAELHLREFRSLEDYISKVRQIQEMEADKAPAAGSGVHDALEAYFKGEEPTQHKELCRNVAALVADKAGEGTWKPETIFVHPLGYGGKVDLPGKTDEFWVIDYKTSKHVTPEWDAKGRRKKVAWPDHAMQLAAYRVGLQVPKARCANIFVGMTDGEPNGVIHWHEWAEDELQNEWEIFKHLLAVWQRRNFDSSFDHQEAA